MFFFTILIKVLTALKDDLLVGRNINASDKILPVR
jgi:hypothetical protein